MTNAPRSMPEAATGAKLAAFTNPEPTVLDKDGYAQRWLFSRRHVDNLIAQGLPHLKIGERRVRILIAEADAWMRERFGVQRLGRASKEGAK